MNMNLYTSVTNTGTYNFPIGGGTGVTAASL